MLPGITQRCPPSPVCLKPIDFCVLRCLTSIVPLHVLDLFFIYSALTKKASKRASMPSTLTKCCLSRTAIMFLFPRSQLSLLSLLFRQYCLYLNRRQHSQAECSVGRTNFPDQAFLGTMIETLALLDLSITTQSIEPAGHSAKLSKSGPIKPSLIVLFAHA